MWLRRIIILVAAGLCMLALYAAVVGSGYGAESTELENDYAITW